MTEDLMAQVARGDERAFESLYDYAAAPVAGVVRQVVVDRAWTDAVVCDVWVEVWRRASRSHVPDGSAISWIMSIAHRRSVDWIRSRDLGAQSASTPSGGARSRASEDLLGKVSASERLVIAMAYYQGMTCDQIGERLGEPLDKIKFLVRKGLMALRNV